MNESDLIRSYKDRLRIFLILYYFSDDYSDSKFPLRKKVFKSEVRIQKIDFLLRNPDYLSYELLNIAENDESKKEKIKSTIQNIYGDKEPIIRRLEMERFFFGAYEDIDDIIAFLDGFGFIIFESKRDTALRTIEKQYYITEFAINKMRSISTDYPSFDWYIQRCALIDSYFGNLSGTELKISQYKIDEYKNTSYNEYIRGIDDAVLKKYREIYGEEL